MAASQQVVPGLFMLPVGIVNTFLIDAPDGCVLVDAGLPGRDADILRGVAVAGRRPTDVRPGEIPTRKCREGNAPGVCDTG
jgi:hypothetical protein